MTTRTSTQRGYGYSHQQTRKQLLYNHTDGSECEYCGQPMYKDPARNFDHKPLNADHLETDKTRRAGRLLHDQCNKKMNTAGRWVKHGPEWYAKHGQVTDTPITDELDWPNGSTIVW